MKCDKKKEKEKRRENKTKKNEHQEVEIKWKKSTFKSYMKRLIEGKQLVWNGEEVQDKR